MKITVKDGMGRGPNGVTLPAYDQQGNVLGYGEWEVVEKKQGSRDNLNWKNVSETEYCSFYRRIYQSTEVKQEVANCEDKGEYCMGKYKEYCKLCLNKPLTT